MSSVVLCCDVTCHRYLVVFTGLISQARLPFFNLLVKACDVLLQHTGMRARPPAAHHIMPQFLRHTTSWPNHLSPPFRLLYLHRLSVSVSVTSSCRPPGSLIRVHSCGGAGRAVYSSSRGSHSCGSTRRDVCMPQEATHDHDHLHASGGPGHAALNSLPPRFLLDSADTVCGGVSPVYNTHARCNEGDPLIDKRMFPQGCTEGPVLRQP